MQLSCRSSSKASSFSVELTDKGKQAGRRRRRSHRAGGGVAMSSTGAPRGRRGRRARDAGAACPGVILGVVLLVVAGALAFVGRSSLCKVVPPVPGNAREASRRTSPRSAKRCDIDRRRSANGEAFRSSHNRTGPVIAAIPTRSASRARPGPLGKPGRAVGESRLRPRRRVSGDERVSGRKGDRVHSRVGPGGVGEGVPAGGEPAGLSGQERRGCGRVARMAGLRSPRLAPVADRPWCGGRAGVSHTDDARRAQGRGLVGVPATVGTSGRCRCSRGSSGPSWSCNSVPRGRVFR